MFSIRYFQHDSVAWSEALNEKHLICVCACVCVCVRVRVCVRHVFKDGKKCIHFQPISFLDELYIFNHYSLEAYFATFMREIQ